MKNSIAYQLNYEDILFLNKNKEYGAFTLRGTYNKNLSFALVLAAILFTGAISYPLFLKENKNINSSIHDSGIVVTLDPLDPNNPNPIPTPIPQVPLKPTIKFLPPKVTPDEYVNNKEIIPDIDELKGKLISSITKDGDDKNGKEIITDNPGPVTEVDKNIPKDVPFQWVEEMPRYKGGDEELYRFFGANMKYPEIAIRAGVAGKVLLSFIVEKDGSISSIDVTKGIGGGCDEEAVRVLRLLDKWSPGRQNGNAVRVRISMPVVFRLR
jgi:protein TonB